MHVTYVQLLFLSARERQPRASSDRLFPCCCCHLVKSQSLLYYSLPKMNTYTFRTPNHTFPKNPDRIPKEFQKNSDRILIKFPRNSDRIPIEFQKNSDKIPKEFKKHSPKIFQTIPQKFPKKNPQKLLTNYLKISDSRL